MRYVITERVDNPSTVKCTFEYAGCGVWQCSRVACGIRIRAAEDVDPAKLRGNCRGLDCIHRLGQLKQRVKVECKPGCHGQYRVAYRCEVHRICIRDGTIAMEPEASMIAVCERCDEREPPEE